MLQIVKMKVFLEHSKNSAVLHAQAPASRLLEMLGMMYKVQIIGLHGA